MVRPPHPSPPPPGASPAASSHQGPHGRSSAALQPTSLGSGDSRDSSLDGRSGSSAPRHDPSPLKTQQDLQVRDSSSGAGLDDSGPRPASYKAALLRPRTFKPRFPAASLQGGQPWLEHRPRRGSGYRALHGGKLHGCTGAPTVLGGGYWLQQLRVKAGTKCFNCLSAGHRIADCRDPPRCILCWHFGHKARFCRRSHSPRIPGHRAVASSAPSRSAAPRIAARSAAIPAPAASPLGSTSAAPQPDSTPALNTPAPTDPLPRSAPTPMAAVAAAVAAATPRKLGVPVGGQREIHSRRVSVHDRLGDRGRDRSPPHDGSAGGGLGLRQMPPAGAHDQWRGRAGGSGSLQRNNSWQAGYHSRRRSMQPNTGLWKWQVKKTGRLKPKSQEKVLIAGDCFLLSERPPPIQRDVDPMLDEAGAGCAIDSRPCPPIVLQCSVEPPATNVDVALAGSVCDNSGLCGEDNCQNGLLKTGDPGPDDVESMSAPVSIQMKQPQAVLPSSELPTLLENAPLPSETDFGHLVEDTGLQLGHLLDLNVGFADAEAIAPSLGRPKNRAVLIDANARLNKEDSDGSNLKTHGKGIARFAVPLRKSLLCNPVFKPRSSLTKKTAAGGGDAVKKIIKTSAKGKVNLSVDDRATAMLLEVSGIIEKNGEVTDAGEDQFGEQFVNHMDASLVEEVRVAFGLNEEGAGTSLNVLALDAAE